MKRKDSMLEYENSSWDTVHLGSLFVSIEKYTFYVYMHYFKYEIHCICI